MQWKEKLKKTTDIVLESKVNPVQILEREKQVSSYDRRKN